MAPSEHPPGESPSGDPAPTILDLPVGLDATGTRTETDSHGSVEVPADHYWGAQTQRSLHHFPIGDDDQRMPLDVVRALALVKKAAARVNLAHGRLPSWMAGLIGQVADEILAGDLDGEFPLRVWQSGSGTHTNMNVNEVISNRCIQLTGGELGSKDPVHPNDHVNRSQSSNDTVPTAMHVAADAAVHHHLVPALERLGAAMDAKARSWVDVVKIGRTHLQDATPLTVGQEWSGYVAALDAARAGLVEDSRPLLELAVGGTAVGTGLNATPGFDIAIAAEIASLTHRPFETAPNKFAALATLDPLVRCSAGLRGVAVALFKIANDLRWLGAGPRAGIHELRLPANEPGSSIMPGKVNPSQAESALMVAVQVLGNDATVAMAGKEGNLELNTFRPVVIANVLHSARILADTCDALRRHLVEGIELDRDRIDDYVDRSVMLVTALTPVIGYDRAAAIAHLATDEDLTLREAAVRSGVGEELFDRVVVPLDLTTPGSADQP